MSALDQAFIKAYAKDPAPAAVASAQATPRGEKRTAGLAAAPIAAAELAPRASVHAAARVIEQIYHDGTLYRVEAPAQAPRRAGTVPAPHVKLLPPTSPRRNMRRSALKLLASQSNASLASDAAPPKADESPVPRFARKVIIRHVAHAAPAPLGLLAANIKPAASELAPERVLEPQVPELRPLPPSERTAPLPKSEPEQPQNLAETAIPAQPQAATASIDAFSEWPAADTYAPLVLVAEPAEIGAAMPESVVSVQLAHFPAPPAAPKEITARFDPPEPRAMQRPHVRCGRADRSRGSRRAGIGRGIGHSAGRGTGDCRVNRRRSCRKARNSRCRRDSLAARRRVDAGRSAGSGRRR
jgi:hypothetical protein